MGHGHMDTEQESPAQCWGLGYTTATPQLKTSKTQNQHLNDCTAKQTLAISVLTTRDVPELKLEMPVLS